MRSEFVIGWVLLESDCVRGVKWHFEEFIWLVYSEGCFAFNQAWLLNLAFTVCLLGAGHSSECFTWISSVHPPNSSLTDVRTEAQRGWANLPKVTQPGGARHQPFWLHCSLLPLRWCKWWSGCSPQTSCCSRAFSMVCCNTELPRSLGRAGARGHSEQPCAAALVLYTSSNFVNMPCREKCCYKITFVPPRPKLTLQRRGRHLIHKSLRDRSYSESFSIGFTLDSLVKPIDQCWYWKLMEITH